MFLASFIVVSAALAPSPDCDLREVTQKIRRGDVDNLKSALSATDTAGPLSKKERACREVLSARIDANHGRAAKAIERLHSAETALPSLAASLRLLATEIAASSTDGSRKKTEALASRTRKKFRKSTPKAMRDRLLLAQARAIESDGDSKAIIRLERRLLRRHIGNAAPHLANLEKALRLVGNERGADAMLRQLLVEHPNDANAREKESVLDDGSLSLEASEAADRIMGLIEASRMARAQHEALAFDRAHAPMGAARVELEVATTQALVRAGQEDAAVDHIAKLLVLDAAEHPTAAALTEQWREVHAWALGKAKRHDAAQAAWRALSIEVEDPALKREACFLGGFLAYEVDRFELAEKEWTRCGPLLEGTPRGAQALWYRALMDVSTHKRESAIKRLRALIKSAPRAREQDKHRYWLAVVLDDTDDIEDKKRAKKVWQKLHAENATSYYGLLSRRRLGIKRTKGVRIASTALSDTAVVPERIRLLFNLGFDDDAVALVRKMKRSTATLAVMQNIGDFHHAWRKGARALPYPRVKKGALVKTSGWRASYPEPFAPLVDVAARDAKISTAFVYAIMRTESGFLVDAKSVAGALGLLQLMPYTAVGIAKSIGKKPPAPSTLTRPDVVIPLGAHFLGRLKREFGATYLAAAAYNGDPRNVSDWMTRFAGVEVELFVERVPFRETRNYIKKVLATEALYRALRGDDLTLDLPTGKVGAPPKEFTSFAFTDDGDDVEKPH